MWGLEFEFAACKSYARVLLVLSLLLVLTINMVRSDIRQWYFVVITLSGRMFASMML